MKNNFLKNEYEFSEAPKMEKEPVHPLKKYLKLFLYFSVFFAMSFSVFFGKALISQNSNGESWINKIPIIGQIKQLAESADKDLKGEERDRINILLLAMGGKQHDGGYLTDTIMLVSFEPSTKKVALLSIPRDMSVPMEGRGWRKVNNINAYAEWEEAGSGGMAISQALSDLFGIPIDYYVRVDFQGFINIIDELGGLKIYVDNTLEDYQYPILGKESAEPYNSRYEHLYIEKGWQNMDGELALKYARSRHGAGIEGSDFARSKRQQKILEAVKDRVLSKNILFQPRMVINILEELKDNLSTNLKVWEIVKLWNMTKDAPNDNIINKNLDNSPNGLLVDTRGTDGAYLLMPRSGDFEEIKYLVNNLFSDAPIETKTKVKVEKATVDVRNGTWVNGLASQIALDLERYGFDIVNISNASRQNFEKSVIYDLSYGEKMESLLVLKEKTGANVTFEMPQWLMDDIARENTEKTNPMQPDFILVLGQDADSSASGATNQEN